MGYIPANMSAGSLGSDSCSTYAIWLSANGSWLGSSAGFFLADRGGDCASVVGDSVFGDGASAVGDSVRRFGTSSNPPHERTGLGVPSRCVSRRRDPVATMRSPCRG